MSLDGPQRAEPRDVRQGLLGCSFKKGLVAGLLLGGFFGVEGAVFLALGARGLVVMGAFVARIHLAVSRSTGSGRALGAGANTEPAGNTQGRGGRAPRRRDLT